MGRLPAHRRWLVLLASAGIVGCGGGDGPGSPSPTATQLPPVTSPSGTPAPTASPTPAATPTPAAAQPALRWTSFGPEGGDVTAVLVDPARPEVAYAATDAAVWRSDDAAHTWHTTAPLPRDRESESHLVVDLGLSASFGLFAAAEGAVFRSDDGADTWRRVSRAIELRDERFFVVALAVGDGAGETAVYVATTESVHRSDDGGASWTTLDLPPAALAVSLAIDPARPGRVLAGQVVGGSRSEDRGATWLPLGLPAVALGPPTYLLDFAFDRSQPGTAWAAAGEGGVFATDDAGATWSERNQGVAIAPMRVQQAVRAIARLPGGDGLLAASVGNLYASEDGGRTWRPSSSGLTARDVAAIAVDPASPGRVVVGTLGGGVAQSTDSGASWESTSRGLFASHVLSVAADATDPSLVYAGTGTRGDAFGLVPPAATGRIFRSRDRGRSWSPLGGGLPSGAGVAVAVDPTAPSTLLAAIAGAGIHRSVDGGETWRASSTPTGFAAGVGEIAVQPAGGRAVVAAVGSLLVSRDGGESWTPAALAPSGADATKLCDDFTGAAVDPLHPRRIYAASGAGVIVSEDDGTTWSGTVDCGVFASLVQRHVVLPDPSIPDRVYATIFRRLAVSVDGGRSFAPVGSDLPEEPIAALAHDGHRLYAAVAGHGVYRSTGDLASWEPWNEGLADVRVDALALADGETTTLFAATAASGVALRDVDSPP